MRKITFLLLLLWMGGKALANEGWVTSFPEAAEQATREGKLLLLDFTGSDWCGWCMKLDAETFSKPEFLDFAGKSVMLVQLDFPRNKPQSDDLKNANHALQKKYDVSGFPTVLIVKPDGKVLWQHVGYVPGGPKVMIDAINQCRKASGLAVVDPPAPSAPVAVAAPKPSAAPPPPSSIQRSGDPQKKQPVEPILQGVVYSASHSAALVDGKFCEVGDTVEGMRIIKIERNKVTVEYKGQTRILKM